MTKIVGGLSTDEEAELVAALRRVQSLLRETRVKGKYKTQVDGAYSVACEVLGKLKL